MQKIMMKSRVFLIMLVLFLVLTPMTALAETGKKEEINYVSLGDSLAAGLLFNRNIGIGYVGNIVGELESKGYHVNVSNRGIPGATSTDVLTDLLNVLELAEADIVTISAGANDLLGELDMSKFENFDPTYLSPEAVEQMISAVQIATVENVVVAVETGDKAVDEASINVEAVSIAVEELVGKMAAFEAFLPPDVKEALKNILSNLELAKEKVEDAKGNVEISNESLDAGVEDDVKSLQVKLTHLEEVSNHLDIVMENIVILEAKLKGFSSLLPDIAEIEAGMDTVKVLTSIAKIDIDTAKQAFDSAVTTISAYFEKMEEIDSLVENAIEVQQMMAGIPGKIATVGQNVGQIVMAIKQVNPNAKVYVLGYYNALPYLSVELQEQYTVPLLVGLNETNQAAATATEATFIPTFDLFEGLHGTYLPNPVDIHPSETGYQVIAGAFMSRISESFPKIAEPEPKPKEEPKEETPPANVEEVPPVSDGEENSEETTPISEGETTGIEKSPVSVVEVVKDEATGTGGQLPNTATNQYHWLLAGVLFLLLGSGLLLLQQKRKQSE